MGGRRGSLGAGRLNGQRGGQQEKSNGHGSHVSGTAAGFGVTAAGATFTGPYDGNNSTYAPLRIVPGAAPKALPPRFRGRLVPLGGLRLW